MCGAGLVGLAGCGGSEHEGTETGGSGGTPTAEPTTTGTSTPTSTPEPQVRATRLQEAVFQRANGSYEIYDAPDSQYLFLAGDGVMGDNLTFRYGGGEYEPGISGSGEVVQAAEAFSSDVSESGWVVFELPTATEPGDPEFIGDGVRWEPDDELQSRLTAPLTPVDVFDFEVSASADGRPEFSVSVYNSGINPVRFLGIIRRSNEAIDFVQLVSHPLPAKTSTTLTTVGDPVQTPEESSGLGGQPTYDLIWPQDTDFVTYSE